MNMLPCAPRCPSSTALPSAGLVRQRVSFHCHALVCILLLAFLPLAPRSASAQVTYGGDSVIATGFGLAANVTEDNQGDIFVYDLFAKSIYWFAPDSQGKYSTTQTVATGLPNVLNISVDAGGTLLFVTTADGAASSLIVYQKNSGTYSQLEAVNPGPANAFPIAVDSTSNIAVVDETDTYLFFGNYTKLPVSNLKNLGVLGIYPVRAAAVSPDDNIFLAGPVIGTTDNSIIKFEQNGTVESTDPAGMLTNDSVYGMALDGFSNLYAALQDQNVIDEIADTHDGNYTQSTVLSGGTPQDVATDRFGNLSYINGAQETLSVDVRYPAIDFGTVAVGSSVTRSLFVTVSATSAVDAGVFISNLVLPPATADFSASYLASTCSNPATNTWYCAVPVVFSPTEPGIRTDALEIKDSGGNVLTTVYLSGNATGSTGALAYTSHIIGQAAVPLNGVTIDSARGVAADPSGNIYVLDQASLQIVKYTRTGPGAYSGSSLRITGLSLTTPGLNYIAVDAAGNIYTDQGTSIVKISPSGQAATVPIGITLGAVSGLYADSYGMLHISDNVKGQVVMLSALGNAVVERSLSGAKFAGIANSPGTFSTVTFLGTGGFAPFGPSYAVDTQNQKLDEFGFPLSGYQFSGFTYAPRQLAFDSSENLIFADPASSSFVGYNPSTLSTFSLPIAPPESCTPDSLIQTEAGDYVASSSDCGEVIVYAASQVLLPPSVAASFSPSSIALGDSSTITLTITNPNINLALTGVGFSDNLPAGLSVGSTSFGNTCGQIISASPNSFSLSNVSMAASASCKVTVPIVPTEYGIFQDSTGVITSNEEGNGAAASATLTVTSSAPTVTGVSPASGLPAGGTAVTITGTNFDATSVSVNFGTAAATDVTVVNAGKITATTPAGTGTVDVTVTTPSGTSPAGAADQFAYVAPIFVVNTTDDDSNGSAANCPAGGSATACTLRDALAAALTAGSGNIIFSASAFNSPQTIVASNGTLSIPSLTSITGPTGGSGTLLRNLVTISGTSTNDGYSAFTVASGVTSASIANLTITNSGSAFAGGINNAGALTIQNCTVAGTAGDEAGAIYNNGGALVIADSSIDDSHSGHYGGALYTAAGSVTVTNSTISGNSAVLGSGGFLVTGGTLNVIDSTISGNFAELYGPGIYNTHGTLTVTNSVVSGNQQGTPASPGNYDDIDDLSGDTTFTTGNGGGNLIGYYNSNSATPPTPASDLAPLGNYGGPTQTMVPLPGSAAICAAALAGVPSGATTDERGYPLQPTGGYCPSGTVDSGAVQSNYTSVQFVQQPTNIAVNTDMSPAPTVEVLETNTLLASNNTDAVGGVPVTLTPSGGTYAGSPFTAATGTTSPYLATFGSLDSTTAASGISLSTSPIPVTGSYSLPAVTSGAYDVVETASVLISPAPSSVLAGPKVTFTWSAATGSSGYSFRLGSKRGVNDLYASGLTTKTSVTAANLPINGETIYGRLYTYFGSSQKYTDYVFTAETAAVLTSPAPSAVFAIPEVKFTWSAGAPSSSYSFRLGTTLGANDVYASGVTTETSVTALNLPTNGETIYARLYTYFASNVVYADYVFTAPTATLAALTLPAPGTVLAGSTVKFTWSSGTGSSGYSFRLGTSLGANDLLASGVTTKTSVTVNNLPTNGETIYARLYTYFGSAYAYTDYVFSAAP